MNRIVTISVRVVLGFFPAAAVCRDHAAEWGTPLTITFEGPAMSELAERRSNH